MDALDLARWQFGIVTVYHFLFVPLTIGLSFLVALMQTAWYRTGNAKYLGMTKFWGKLFLINFAMGVVTGIVQEFQFGMNWSDYSRFVGDVFGAPLAIEGLIAFFLEATFIGLWIFGWDRLPKLAHLISIWMVAIATNLSAFFILAANSWMQHPVGFQINPERGRAELTSLWAVLNNSTNQVAYPHVGDRVVPHRRGVRHRDQRLAPVPQAARRGHARVAEDGFRRRAALRRGRHGHRRPAGQGDDRAAADEDGRRGGDLGHAGARVVLRLHDRHPGRAERAVLRPRAVPAVVHGDRGPQRRGRGDQRRPARVRGAVRPRRLPADHPGDVLELPVHDRLRHRDRGAGAASGCS